MTPPGVWRLYSLDCKVSFKVILIIQGIRILQKQERKQKHEKSMVYHRGCPGSGRGYREGILKTGDCVAAATRKAGSYPVPEACRENLLTLELDVSDPDDARYREAVNLTLARFGRIDVLINNAGYGGCHLF